MRTRRRMLAYGILFAEAMFPQPGTKVMVTYHGHVRGTAESYLGELRFLGVKPGTHTYFK